MEDCMEQLRSHVGDKNVGIGLCLEVNAKILIEDNFYLEALSHLH